MIYVFQTPNQQHIQLILKKSTIIINSKSLFNIKILQDHKLVFQIVFIKYNKSNAIKNLYLFLIPNFGTTG